MDEFKSNNHRVEEMLDDIRSLLSHLVNLQTDANDLEEQGFETNRSLLQHATNDTALSEQRTGLAEERTSLVRAQTSLSTRSSELAEIRTDMSRERGNLAIERTDLSVVRTELARGRTNLAQQRVHMAEERTQLADKRTMMSITTTVYSKIRSELARGRTNLALIRTGLAFITLSIFLLRTFSISWWSIFDITLLVFSVIATIVGIAGYIRATRKTRYLDTIASESEAKQPDFEMLKA